LWNLWVPSSHGHSIHSPHSVGSRASSAVTRDAVCALRPDTHDAVHESRTFCTFHVSPGKLTLVWPPW
jgi:hypothetical protein